MLGQSAITSDTEVVITIAGQEHRYQPRPELGYVVKSQDYDQVIASTYGDISLLAEMQIRPVGGRERKGLWIVERQSPAAENEKIIKTLKTRSQIKYAAPIFSSNGEMVVVIPEIVIRVHPGVDARQVHFLCESVALAIIKPIEFTTQEYLLQVLGPDAESVFTALENLNNIDWIEWAAPNIVSQRKRPEPAVSQMQYSAKQEYLSDARGTYDTSGFIPNDEYFPYQWHLHNTGQLGGTPDADINASEAWEITTGEPNIVVAVLDTGVDTNHPDLMANLVPGYDFFEDDDRPDPDEDAHGTTCAGLIAAKGNNGIGVTGVTWNCSIIPIRTNIWDSWYVAPESEIATAIRWAAVHGAHILSNSWGYYVPLPIIHSAFVDVTKPGGIGRGGKGCVVFVSSGNESRSLNWPARYPELIAVGATDHNDARWSYSNYGPELDIVAPSGQAGRNLGGALGRWSNTMILTTDITGQPGLSSDPRYKYGNELDYSFFGGTSGACPVAAGVAALILSIEPELTNEEVRHFLCRSAKDLGDPGWDRYYGWGRVDARAALDMVLAKRADLNNDWKVDLEDLLLLIECWENGEPSADIAPATRRDGVVDEQDLDLIMRYWQTEIPELPELGLIAHWALDETEGDIAQDSARSYDGFVIGGPIWQPGNGIVDGALQLDGIDDYVSTPFVLNPADGKFSVFAWIKGGAPGQAVLSQIGGVNWLCADPLEGNLITELKGLGRGGAELLSQTVVTDGNWHRIGLVWDGSHRTLYVDDLAVAEDTQTNLEASENGLYIGAGKAMEPGSFWSGLIDDVRIYNRAVTP